MRERPLVANSIDEPDSRQFRRGARARGPARPPRAAAARDACDRVRDVALARGARRARCDGRAQELMLLTRSSIIRAENLSS